MTTEENHVTKHRSWLDRILNILDREPQNREELTEILRHAEERDLVSSEMLGMMERILQVADMQVREVMVPKAQMVAVRKNNRLDEILPLVIESGHSRFPVIDPADGEIIGILLAKDLLPYCYNRDASVFELVNIMRHPAIFTPQSKRLDILLREFRINRNHMAIVLDEYGHVAGLVTIEDVLEQIVGEIEDEYDTHEEHDSIRKLDDAFIVKASTPITEFNHYFATDFSKPPLQMIGEYILDAFGHLPKRSEIIKLKNLRFKVLHSDNRRIYLLEVKRTKKEKE